MTLATLLPSSTGGIMGLREERPASSPSSLSWNPDSMDDGFPTFIWGWYSEPPDCPPDEGCKPEPMAGTMNRPRGTLALQGGEEVRTRDNIFDLAINNYEAMRSKLFEVLSNNKDLMEAMEYAFEQVSKEEG